MYLKSFNFASHNDNDIIAKHKYYNSFYPFQILSRNNFYRIDFEPITILYGNNGSGKSTALNIIAAKLGLRRDTIGNSSSFFSKYLQKCHYEIFSNAVPDGSRLITSDDVFDLMLNVRNINEGIDAKREDLFAEHLKITRQDTGQFRLHGLQDLEALEKIVEIRKTTQSKYVKRNLGYNIRERSNGESAFNYFVHNIKENALYLLDEPENSLAPALQLELQSFLEDSARFYGCQLVIATHSPFLLSLKHAKIYDLDDNPVSTKKWTELANVRAYYEFFRKHEEDFR